MQPFQLLCLALLAALPAAGANAAQIYECLAIGGGDFYSATPCGQHNALGRMVHTVPDGMPYAQQLALVKQRKGDATTREAPVADAAACRRTARALEALDRKYSQGRHIEIDEVNRDQAARRDLKAERARLKC